MGIRSMPFFKGKKGFQFAGGGNIDEYGDLPIATTSSAGCVKPDGTTINVTAQGGISVPTGSDTAKGIFQVDNETIKAANGVLSTDALIKAATLPAASATTLGKIFMYTGATGGGLTSGHIYKCTSAGDPAVYSWTELPVQDVSALTSKTDLSAVIATGTTNGTGSQIDAGTYFYLNGDYCVAKTDIAANATFTLNTNYEVVTVGGVLSELNSNKCGKIRIRSLSVTTNADGSAAIYKSGNYTPIAIYNMWNRGIQKISDNTYVTYLTNSEGVQLLNTTISISVIEVEDSSVFTINA